jgi:demethylmenaquinone methyltransferase/2-methoxy-6-polyprenyl-1,4-benzoquinol methylase
VTTDSSDALLHSQRVYYDERAPDYMDLSKPSDRKGRGFLPDELCAVLIDEFAPIGHVLELACGSGWYTREIVRHATSVTAVDGSPRMIERNRTAVGDRKVNYIVADIFAWEPDRAYDAVLFSAWLSHVPPDRFDDFWRIVRACLAPGGRVCFIDEDDGGAINDDVRVVDGIPIARRTLADGRAFDIVKCFWSAANLEERLRSIGWDVGVRSVGGGFLFGSGQPA